MLRAHFGLPSVDSGELTSGLLGVIVDQEIDLQAIKKGYFTYQHNIVYYRKVFSWPICGSCIPHCLSVLYYHREWGGKTSHQGEV